MRHLCLLVCTMLLACGEAESPGGTFAQTESLSSSELESLRSARIFFGHQSVGRNVLTGIAEATDLRIVSASDPSTVEGPALIEAAIGRNGTPATKDQAFLEAVARLGPGDVALYKYCYVDMGVDSDPDSLAARYERTLAQAAAQEVYVVAVTMPLTTAAPAWKRWIKRALGRTTTRELNARRHRFNEKLRHSEAARPLVDLARMEATRPDGRVATVSVGGQSVEVLADSYTDDGSHLDARGRGHVAPLFLRALARAVEDSTRSSKSSR